ncbi:MAG: hypothetical protein AB1349_12895 [Elusimicrobiota bacterium]
METITSAIKSLKAPAVIRRMGSDCVYCYLEQGITCMMYFCKKKSVITGRREICTDGFRGRCADYKPCY